MQFTAILAAMLAVTGTSLAAPAAEANKSMMAAGSTWTMQNFKRTCGPLKKQCTYSYSINTNDGSAATPCTYKVNSDPSVTPAARAGYQNQVCGAFTIGSSWSGQFGAGNGFQTLSVVKGKQIIYPSYTDAQLDTMQVVKPDQSYTPQNLS